MGADVLTLMSGQAFGQAIVVLAAPLLARLYTPSDFGVFALYSMVILLSGPVVSARYELAIVPAESDDEAFGLLVLCCSLTLIMAIAAAGLFRILAILKVSSISLLYPYSWLVPIGILAAGWYQALRQFCVRSQRFRAISVSNVVQTGVATGAQSLGGVAAHLGAWGLLVGQLMGIVASSLNLARGLSDGRIKWRVAHRGRMVRALWDLAMRHQNHPIYLPWGGFVDTLAQRLPVLVLPSFFGPVFLGIYAMADRLLRLPTSLAGQASSQVLFQRMSEPSAKPQMTAFLARWTMVATAAVIPPSLLLLLFGKAIFVAVLGSKWAGSGELAVILIPMYWGALVVSPISNLLIVGKKQGLLLGIQMLFLVSGFLSFWLGNRLFHDGRNTLLLYSLSQTAVYVLYLFALFVVAMRVTETARQVRECAA